MVSSDAKTPNPATQACASEERAWLPADFGFERCVQTHVSLVYIGRTEVLKRKRAVALHFVDHSSLAARIDSCFKECELNARLSQDVYLGVRFLYTDATGAHVLSALYTQRATPPATTIDAIVCMRRLPEEDSLIHRLKHDSDQTVLAVIHAAAQKIAHFHTTAKVVVQEDVDEFLSAASENTSDLRALCSHDPTALSQLDAIVRLQQTAFVEHRSRLQQRAQSAMIRDGHGDLRLEHIYWNPGSEHHVRDSEITIIDCIEFSDSLRVTDVLSDASFLAMELDEALRGDFAASYFSYYAAEAESLFCPILAPLFCAYRALVRAKVNALQAQEHGELFTRVKKLLSLAYRYFLVGLDVPLILCGGPMGVGKSTAAKEIAELLGARYISSDACRVEVQGEDAERLHADYGEAGYTDSAKRAVYEYMAGQAMESLARAQAVVLDATFSKNEYRKCILDTCCQLPAIAGLRNLRISQVFFRADEQVLRERLSKRSAARDRGEAVVSDGRLELLAQHLAEFEWPNEDAIYEANREVDPIEVIRFLYERDHSR